MTIGQRRNRIITVLAAALAFAVAAPTLSGCGAADASTSSTAVKVVNVATSGGPAPYILKGKDGKLDGQNIELLRAIFARLPQYKLNIQTVDFSAIFSGLDSGRYDMGVNNFAKTAEREKRYTFSLPLYNKQYAVATTSGSGITTVTGLESFAGKTLIQSPTNNVGVALKAYNDKHSDAQITLKFSQSDLGAMLSEVAAGRADGSINDVPVNNYYAHTLDLDLKQVIIQGDNELAGISSSYFIFPKDADKQLVSDVNNTFIALVKDGTSKKINNKWFYTDLTPKLSDLQHENEQG